MHLGLALLFLITLAQIVAFVVLVEVKGIVRFVFLEVVHLIDYKTD